MGSGAKSYRRKRFFIDEEMRKYLVICEEAVSHMSLQPLLSEFSYICPGKFSFLFYQCSSKYEQQAKQQLKHQTTQTSATK
jgi:hypothetical protein